MTVGEQENACTDQPCGCQPEPRCRFPTGRLEGRGWRLIRLRLGLSSDEDRNIRALRYFDSYRVGTALFAVIPLKPLADPPGLSANDAVSLRIVIRITAEKLDGNRGFFELLAAAVQHGDDNKLQKASRLLCTRECGAAGNR